MASLQFTRNQVRGFLFVMLTMDAILIGTVLGVVGSPTAGMIGFACGLLLPFLIFRGLVPLIAGAVGWWSLERLYPPVGTPEFDARAPLASVSMQMPLLGMNNCIEVAQDADHLHLRIFGLIGPPMMPVSIPWTAITSITVTRRGIAAVVLDQGPRMWFPEKVLAGEIALREELAPIEHTDEAGAA